MPMRFVNFLNDSVLDACNRHALIILTGNGPLL